MAARLWLVLALLVPLSSRAEAPQILSEEQRSAQAKQLFERGMASFQLEEWDAAIEAWEQGFRTKPVPQFLYNIAQAHRLAKRYEKAASFYKKYLSMDPKAGNRAEVERHIATLHKLIEEQRRASAAQPTSPIKQAPEPKPVVAVVEPKPTPKPVAVEPKSSRPSPSPDGARKGEPVVVEPKSVLVETRPVDNRPITKKGWFWGVIGGAAAVVVAGVVIGVVVGTADNTRNLPAVSF